ncbi:MAG: carboxypeptidase-like regulatory domain-containing protein [Candidatus Acidiferrales bacterium]
MNFILSVKALRAAGFGILACLLAGPAMAARSGGMVSGVVVDSAGTPQMGATVLLTPDSVLSGSSVKLLTDDRGHFGSTALPIGLYSIQVTLAGFLPAIDRNVRVKAEGATVLQIMLGTVFSSFEQLRRPTDETISSDDWTWVLRSSAATRSVLRWQDAGIPLGASPKPEASPNGQSIRGGLLLSSGSDNPGSVADVPNSAATAVVYDLDLGSRGQLLMAGQFSYDDASSSEGFAGELLPSDGPGTGPVTTILVRETRLGPTGPEFRGLRLTHDDQFMVGDRVSIRYGAELLTAGFGGTTTTVRPHGEVAVQVSPNWETSLTIATRPWDDGTAEGAMQSAADTLDAFPILLMHRGEPVFEDDLHEELAVRRQLGSRADLSAAVFHDSSNQTAVIGRGDEGGPDALQDSFSQAFAYDGGHSSSTGARIAYREKFSGNLAATLVYAYAGALSAVNGADASGPLRNQLATRYRQSVAGRVSSKIPYLRTRLSAGYEWIDGRTVSLQDPYGESLYHVDPYLSMEIRQPLPSIFPCHMEVQADIGNLLAQGYVQVATRDGYVVLVPSYRYIRGGLSFQF